MKRGVTRNNYYTHKKKHKNSTGDVAYDRNWKQILFRFDHYVKVNDEIIKLAKKMKFFFQYTITDYKWKPNDKKNNKEVLAQFKFANKVANRLRNLVS